MDIYNIYNILKSKPHNSHYLNRYIKFIEFCKSVEEPKIYEKHHILPKSKKLFPQYASFNKFPENEIKLSLRQHYIAHLLLWKCFGGTQAQAFKLMCGRSKCTNSKLYEAVRTEHSASVSGKLNCNYNGVYSKKSWDNCSPERRKNQSKLLSELNTKLKTKPKEERTYTCTECSKIFNKVEFLHHPIQTKPFCCQSCAVRYTGKQSAQWSRGSTRDGHPAWNKGKPGTGFGNIKTNPMKNPESVQKMLDTRKRNKMGVLDDKEPPNPD